VLVYTLGQWRDIVKIFARRQARYGTLAATSVLVVLGILVAINYIGARQNKRWTSPRTSIQPVGSEQRT